MFSCPLQAFETGGKGALNAVLMCDVISEASLVIVKVEDQVGRSIAGNGENDLPCRSVNFAMTGAREIFDAEAP